MHAKHERSRPTTTKARVAWGGCSHASRQMVHSYSGWHTSPCAKPEDGMPPSARPENGTPLRQERVWSVAQLQVRRRLPRIPFRKQTPERLFNLRVDDWFRWDLIIIPTSGPALTVEAASSRLKRQDGASTIQRTVSALGGTMIYAVQVRRSFCLNRDRRLRQDGQHDLPFNGIQRRFQGFWSLRLKQPLPLLSL